MRLFTFFILLSCSLQAQFMTTLQPKTVEQFDAYARKIDESLTKRWTGHESFLEIDRSPAERTRVVQGDASIRQSVPDEPISVNDGLIHDWTGDIFIPNTTPEKVVAMLEDFDVHSKIYPDIVQSRTLHRDGHQVTGLWRLEKKGAVIPVVLDVTDEASYEQAAPGKWFGRAYARQIQEIENAGTPQEKKLPVGQGNGFLWRLYAYWSLESLNGGVLAECRTSSLSRSVPPAVAWMVKPFLKSLPKDSLGATLSETKAALAKQER